MMQGKGENCFDVCLVGCVNDATGEGETPHRVDALQRSDAQFSSLMRTLAFKRPLGSSLWKLLAGIALLISVLRITTMLIVGDLLYGPGPRGFFQLPLICGASRVPEPPVRGRRRLNVD